MTGDSPSSFRVATWNVLGRTMARCKWFSHALDYLPPGYPRNACWPPNPHVLPALDHSHVRFGGEMFLRWRRDGSQGFSTGAMPFAFGRWDMFRQWFEILDADILCLQEMDFPAEIRTAMPPDQFELSFIPRPLQPQRDGCLVVVRSSKFRVLGRAEVLRYSNPADTTRIAVRHRLRHLESGRTFSVVNTHLEYTSEKASRAQFLQCLELIRWMSAFKEDIILCGDFNRNPDCSFYERILKHGFQDCYGGDPYLLEFTSIKPDSYFYKTGLHVRKPYWIFRPGRKSIIDYIFHSGDQFKCIDRQHPLELCGAESLFSGHNAFASPLGQPDASFEAGKYDPAWRPKRSEDPQIGLPNRFFPSDHLPLLAIFDVA